MAKIFRVNKKKNTSRSKMSDSAPGSLIFVGEQKMKESVIKIMQYDEQLKVDEKLDDVDRLFERIDSQSKNWVNIDGIHDTAIVEKIGKRYQMDPLLMEDILDTRQRPKCEEYNGQLYIVLRMIRYDDRRDVTISEQFSMVLIDHCLFTFQEVTGDVLDGVRNRIRKSGAKIHTESLNYLAYAIIDVMVDNYIYAIEKFGEKIETIDQQILSEPRSEMLEQINYYKREVNYLRKVIRPVRELVFQLDKSEFLEKINKSFVKDLLDHITFATEAIETYRELLSDQLNVYHTSMSHRLNQVIRLLTIYSVIFTPLTFLTGIYGMNFRLIPELDYRYAYPIFWGVLIFISISMVIYFRRKRWL